MKNFIVACIAVVLMLAGTVYSSATVNGFTEKTEEYIYEGNYRDALLLYNRKKSFLSAVINGNEIFLFEQALTELNYGHEGAKERVLFLCEEISRRERIGLFG